MDNRLIGIEEALAALHAAGGATSPSAVSPGALVAINRAFGALLRQVNAAFAPVAAEIARQSRVEFGKESLARTQGFRSPVAMIQATTGSSVGDAVKLVQVGEATAPRTSVDGDEAPAPHPHVAAAVSAGDLSVMSASAIVSLLDRLERSVDPAARDGAERQLCERAPGLRSDELARLLASAEIQLDPGGVAGRHEEHRSRRSLTMHERDGMLHLTGQFDVETGAPIKTAIDAIVTGVLQRNEHADDATHDDRSLRQMRADALSDLCGHALGCTEVLTAATTTVVVRMTLEELEKGIGVARIDGMHAPLPAGALRRLASDLQVLPCVLGGDSEILNWGRRRRLFSPAQKLALVERDGGCAQCGAPPTWTHVHHIAWWNRDSGPTDLSNGVLLCTGCHHRLHSDGWDIRIEGTGVAARVWFIPPPWIDPDRAPRLGGVSTYALAR